MISTLLRISQLNLARDRVAWIMVFVLPIAFFSIFATVFGRQSMNSTSRLRIGVVDQDRSDASLRFVAALKQDPGLRARDSVLAPGAAAGATPEPLSRERAETLVRGGDFPVAIVIPPGWGASFPDFMGRGERVEVLADVSDPVASNMIVGLLQRSGATVLGSGGATAGAGGRPDFSALVRTRTINLMGESKRGSRMVAFYAAGIAVMFLLFSCSAAGGVLLEEQESGTLERVLNTNLSMGLLLAGKWAHVALLGVLQITVMFLWGALAFRLALFDHLPGFLIMTVATAAAASAFGLVLATLCRTRQQLSGFATLIILVMSALGGSMFPRFLMSETMQKVGLVTFNAWALDGYIKVFWREAPLLDLWPQLLVLATLTAVFLTAARLFARRWERA